MKYRYDSFHVARDDIEEIIKIENNCYLTPWTEQNFNDAIEANNLFMAFKEGNVIIGYFIALISLNECELLNLVVKVDYQDKGIGKIILNHLLDYCKKNKITNIFLEVRFSNKKAISLYEKKGFNELGLRKNYYKKEFGREDALLMGLTF